MIELQPHTFRFPSERDGKEITLEGFIVPETEGLLFIDERFPAEGFEDAVWYITHIPTCRHMQGKLPEISTRDRAAQVAQQLFREFKAHGWDLNTTDADSIKTLVRSMPHDAECALWERVNA